MQNIFHVKSFSFYLEIETMFAGAKAEKLLTRPLEMAQGLMGLRQISRLDCPQRLDDRQLSERVELVELVHGLFGKGDLKHGGKTGAHRRRAFRCEKEGFSICTPRAYRNAILTRTDAANSALDAPPAPGLCFPFMRRWPFTFQPGSSGLWRWVTGFCWLVAFTLGCFAAQEPAPVELDIPVHAAGYGVSFFEETARQFEALRPGVKVNIYGDPRIGDRVRIRAIGGNYPDATTAELLWPQLIASGHVLDLTPYLDGPNWEGDARWGDTFLPGVLESWRLGGRVYGLPFAHSCWTIFYNKKRFRELGLGEPRTWDEFFATCRKLRASGIAPLALPGVYMRYGDTFLRSAHYNLVGLDGWRAYNALEAGARTDPRFIRAAALIQEITTQHLITGWEGLTHTGAQLALLEGRAAMTVSGSWMVNEMRGKLPPDFELGAMNFPACPDGIVDPTTLQTSGEYFFLFQKGDPAKERLAVDFFRFLTSRARAEAFVRQVDSPVAIKGVPQSAFSPQMRDTASMIERAAGAFSVPPNMLQPPALMQIMTDARYRLFTGLDTPEQFGAKLEAAAQAERERDRRTPTVKMRHPWGGTLLLAALGAVAGFLAWRAWSKLRAAKHRADAQERGLHFGRLKNATALGFVGPALLLYGGLVVLPGLAAFAWAFVHWDGLGERTWAGLFNFRWLLFESDAFWHALRNNLYLVVVPAITVVPLALGLATLIHRGVWGAKIFRAVLLFPNLLGGIAATLLWMNAYEPHGGLVNASLVALGQLTGSAWLQSFAGYPWLAQANLYHALIPIYLWSACGFNLILYLAAMEGIDADLYEAAELDGASPVRQFFTITLPLIWEVVAISAVFLVIGGLNAFEMIWLLTSQDPATGTHTLGTLLVTTMFKEFQIGRATAIAVTMFVLVLATSAVVMRVFRRERVED